MNRRGFLQRLGAVAVATALSRHLPGIAPTPPVVPAPGMSALRTPVTCTSSFGFDFEWVTLEKALDMEGA